MLYLCNIQGFKGKGHIELTSYNSSQPVIKLIKGSWEIQDEYVPNLPNICKQVVRSQSRCQQKLLNGKAAFTVLRGGGVKGQGKGQQLI